MGGHGNHGHHDNQEHVPHVSHKKLYIIVFVVLTVLTILELMIPDLKCAYWMKASSLTFLALGKAFLVAYIYMHLNEETKWMKFVAAIPAFAVVYATFIIVETIIR